MPLKPTSTGFVVTYARGRCVVFGALALVFALAMVICGVDVYVPVLDGTLLEQVRIERQPPWLWAGITIAGGILFAGVAYWNARNAFGNGIAIEVGPDGVDARTLVGCRTMRWDAVGTANIVQGTLFLFPVAGSASRPVPLQTFLTSVKTDELVNAILNRKPELFGTIEKS